MTSATVSKSTSLTTEERERALEQALLKRAVSAEKSVSSDEAYCTVVKIERYRDVEGTRFEVPEDSYCFEIGKRTFPEVLTLVDKIKELMK